MLPLALWRLDSTATMHHPDTLIQGLERHLARDDLLSVLVQIGTAQQGYVGLRGCEGCTADACAIGCRVALLRRVLRASLDAHATLDAVPLGLAPRPYTRAALAWPTPQSVPLDGTLLAPWPEARLTVHWRRRLLPQVLVCTTLLLVGADGPDPVAALRAAQWRAVPLLPRLIRASHDQPTALWGVIGTPWPHTPFLLLPQPVAAVQQFAA